MLAFMPTYCQNPDFINNKTPDHCIPFGFGNKNEQKEVKIARDVEMVGGGRDGRCGGRERDGDGNRR